MLGLSKRQTKFILLTLLAALTVTATVAVWMGLERASPVVCGLLQKQLAEQLDGEVHFEVCSIHLLQRTASFRKVTVEAQAAGFFLDIEALRVKLKGLRWRGLEFQEIVIEKPNLRLKIQSPTLMDASGKPADASAKKACWVGHLSRWVVQKLEVVEGGFALEFPGELETQLQGFSLQWLQKETLGRFRVGVEEGKLQFQKRQENIGRLRLEGELDAGGERLRLSSGEFNLGQMLWRSSGEVEDLCAPKPYVGIVSQVYLPAEMLARWLNLSGADGHFWARVALNGRSHQLTARAELDAVGLTLADTQPGDFRAKLAFSGKTLQVEELRIPIGEGSAELQGELQLEDSWPVQFWVTTQKVSLAQVLERSGLPGSWVDFEADVKGKFSGQLFPRLSIWGDVDAYTGPFILAARSFRAPKHEGIDIVQFQQSRSKFRFGILEDRVEFQNAYVEAGPHGLTQAEGTVKIFFKDGGGISVEGKASKLHLSDFGHIAQIPLAGTGSGRVSVFGKFDGDIQVHGEARLQDFVFGDYSLGVVQASLVAKDNILSFPNISGQKRKTPFFGQVDLNFQEEAPKLVAFAHIPKGRAEDILEVLLPLHPAFEALQGKLGGNVSGSLAFASPAEAFTGLIQLEVDGLELMQLPLGKGSTEVSLMAGQTLRISPTSFASKLGRLRVLGSWDFEGAMDFSAHYETQSLGKWLGTFLPEAQALVGPLAIHAHATGDANVPEVSFVAHSPQLLWKDKKLGPMRLEGRLLGRELTLVGAPVTGVHLSGGIRLREPYAYHVSSAVELSGISFDLPMLASLKAQLTARGELNNPKALRADADIELLRFFREGFSVSNRAPARLTYADEKFKLSFLQMEGPNTTLLAQGVLGMADSNFSIYGTFDLRLLETFLPGIESGAGEAGITAVVGGSLLNPSISGVAELNQAQAMLKAWPLAFEQINAQMEFSNQRLWIHDARALANGGQVQVQGALSWSSNGLEDVGIEGQFQKISMEVLPGVPGVFSGNLQLEGGGPQKENAPAALTLSGWVEAEKFRYEKPLVLEDLLTQVGTRSYGEAKPPEEWLKYDVTLKTGDVRIDNNLARARFLGQVQLAGNNAQPDFYGSIETAPGGEAYFRGNTFGIQRGLLQFSGKTDSLQFVAQSQIQEYLVLIRASGELRNPKVVFSSEPSLTEADILSVLTMGTTSGEQSTSSAGLSLVAQAFFSVSGLERWLQSLFSGSALLQGQQMQFATTLNEATGVTEPSVRWESKLLSEQFRLGIVQPLTGRGTKAHAEWRFNERVSLRMQLDNWNQGFSLGYLGNFGFDWKFRFEWE